jgi:hypothetical protein
VRVSPRTRLIPLGVLLLLAACGEPPQQMPASPPHATSSSGSSVAPVPSLPTVTQPLPTLGSYPAGQAYPTYPTYTANVPTTPAGTIAATPTPSHAARCSGAPTAAQIIALIKGRPGIPSAPLKVLDGPFCSGAWSFTTVGLSGETEDQDEPLMVVATGKGTTLAQVAAGSDVCIDQVQNGAPAGIRVLACGF